MTYQRLAGLQHQAQQTRLAIEAEIETYMKTCKRTEGTAADVVKHGGTSSARVDHDPMRQTSFGEENSTEPPAFPICRDDALVDEGAKAPKLCLLPGEMHTSTPVNGSLLAGTTSTTIRDIFPPPPLFWSFGKMTKKFSTTTAIQTYATYSKF